MEEDRTEAIDMRVEKANLRRIE